MEGEGRNLDASKATPTITIDDLKIDRSKLKMFGQTPVNGINNNEELDSVLRRYMGAINKLFEHPEAAREMMAVASMRLEDLSQVEDLDIKGLREVEGLQMLRDFAMYAAGGKKAEALSVINRSVVESAQDAFAGNSGGIVANFRIDTLTQIPERVDLRDAASSFMDLSRIIYASRQQDGMPYKTAEQKTGLKEAMERINTVKIS